MAPDAEPERPRAQGWPPALVGVLLGVLATPIGLILAIFSAGAGHGDYVLARLVFPAPMLSTVLTNDTITSLAIGLALAQFPAYGAILGRSRPRSRVIAAIAVAAFHAATAALAFSGLLTSFSG